MDNEIEFRIRDPELTAEALNDLYTQVGWNSSGQRTTEKTKRMLSTSPLYVSAVAGNNLIGFGRIISDPYTAQMLDVITHSEYRQRGIARRVTQLLQENLPEGLLGVSLIDGSGYPAFYESLGFETAESESDRLMYLRTSPQDQHEPENGQLPGS